MRLRVAWAIIVEKKIPLVRSAGRRNRTICDRPIDARNALHMIKRRAKAARLAETTCNHTFKTYPSSSTVTDFS